MIEPVSVTTSGKELINSGIVHLDSNEVTFKVRNLIFVFKFVVDKNESRFETEADAENNQLTFKLYNFNNSLGQGLLTPLQLGTLSGKKLFISFFVHTTDAENALRSFQYCFYLEA